MISACFHSLSRSNAIKQMFPGHDHAPCVFADCVSYLRCVSLYCPNPRDHPSDMLCSPCRNGHLPCANRCSRRISDRESKLCNLCREDGSDDPVLTLPSTAQISKCATKGCATLVQCVCYGALVAGVFGSWRVRFLKKIGA